MGIDQWGSHCPAIAQKGHFNSEYNDFYHGNLDSNCNKQKATHSVSQ